MYGCADQKARRISVKTEIQRVSLLRKLCALYLTVTRNLHLAVCSLYGKITKIDVFRVPPFIKCLAERRIPVFFFHFRYLPESKIHIFFICKRRALEILHVCVLHKYTLLNQIPKCQSLLVIIYKIPESIILFFVHNI